MKVMKILPVDWNYTIPFGLLHSHKPPPVIRQILKAVHEISEDGN